MKNKLKIRLKIFILYVFIAFLLFIFGLSIFKILMWIDDNKSNSNQIDEIMSNTEIKEVTDNDDTIEVNRPDSLEDDYWTYMKMNLLEVGFTYLLEKNSDTVGWISVNGTNINYPIVQTTDNNYYLSYAFDKSKNSAGWVFMDNSIDFDNNTIIYVHSRYNGTMFGSLKNILNSSWYELGYLHHIIILCGKYFVFIQLKVRVIILQLIFLVMINFLLF